MRIKAMLLLDDGRLFKGYSFGANGETMGEVCFNTGMTGYQEILTDPSYCGQIVTMTYPHIGNYGINPDDVESNNIQVAGFIVKEETEVPSNYRSTQSIGDYLREDGIVGIQGIDTRAFVRHIRSQGAMNGIISTVDFDNDSLMVKLKQAPSMAGLDLAKKVTCGKRYEWINRMRMSDCGLRAQNISLKSAVRNPPWKVAAIDYGVKWNILRLLHLYGCDITVLPATASATEILSIKPDGILLSNGPGDPAAVTYAINTVKELLGKKPIFGICLGHQILALALGAKTYKLKFGHRGINHPVRNEETRKIEITSQNHGFTVDPDSLPSDVDITHWNLNDDTVEGLRCKDIPAFSVQYHPEASPGPHDSRYLFDTFVNMMK